MAASMEPLSILYVVHGYKPAYRIGGPITSVSAVAEGLVKKGHRVTVFTTNYNVGESLDVEVNKPVDVDGVETWYFEFEEPLQKYLPFVPYLSRANPYLYSTRLREELLRKSAGFDLLHAHIPFVYPTYIASVASERAARPFFYHQRGAFDEERLRFRSIKKRAYIAAVERRVLQRAATLFALSDAEVASYRSIGATAPVVVVPNGIDATKFIAPTSLEPIGSISIEPQDLVILFMARLHPTKGVDRLLEAFKLVAVQNQHAKLVLAGPDEFGLRSRLESIVNESGLRSRVVFPGMVTGEQKRSLLARADLFCLPSDAEGFSIAILEALASETPVLISPRCHFPAVAAAGAGVIVENDPRIIARELTKLLQQPDVLRDMAKRARKLVLDHYRWDTVVDRTEQVYYDVVQRFRAGQQDK
jgi:glycosyltransferase involved in cell wall biosynthesis